jgi:hypothetical protein
MQMRFVFSLGILLVATASIFAQSTDANSKKRLVFPSTGSAAAPAPKATPMPSIDPNELLRQFFDDLKADKLDAAYQGLVKNTIISERTENVEQLKVKTREALDNFGPVTGYEVVETVEIGKSLFRQTCISLNTDVPLRWRFYFYRTGNQWKIVDMRVDDGIVELFDEMARKRTK